MFSTTEPILLHTKTALPVTRVNLVERQRLIESIEFGTQGKLTLVSAPAGFGKTALLGQWVRSTIQSVAWVSLDETDNDPVRFWRYVLESLATLLPAEKNKPFEQLVRTLPSLSTSTFLDALINQLMPIAHPITLVLDDFHIVHESSVHDSVAYFIEHMPTHLHFLVSSRTELPFNTAKWLVQGEYVAIEASQLTFTLEESKLYYRDVAKISLSGSHLEKLFRQTEGWVTGLQLVSISLRTETDYERFVEEFSGYSRDLADYLFQEVVAKLPAEMVEFLLRTSVLGRLDAKACDALTQRTDGSKMLETLKARNLFLVPLDNSETWFRYHRQFAEFLRNRVRKDDPSGWLTTNLLASKSLASRGLLDEAIDHAIAAEEFDLAENLLVRHAAHVLKRGEFPTLLRWFGCFPQSRELAPEMALLYSFLLVVTGQVEQAGHQLSKLELRYAGMEAGEARQQLQSGLLFVKSNLFFSGGEFADWFAFISGILDDILPHNPIFYNFNYNMTDPLVRRTVFGLKGVLSNDTETIGKLFADVLEKHGWGDSLINLYVVQSLAEGYYEWNRLEESQTLLLKVERAARLKLVPGLFVPNRITQANLYWLNGQRDLAYETLDEALRFVAKLPEKHWTRHLLACKVQFLVREGRIAEAKKEMAKLRLNAKDRPIFNQEYEYSALARLLGATRKETEALRLLELLKPQAQRENSLMSITEICIAQACLQDQLGQRSHALRFLHEALTLGEANAYRRSFIDAGEQMEKLLRRYAAAQQDVQADAPNGGASSLPSVSADYVCGLLELFPEPLKEEAPAAQAELIEPLTRAELNLLALIREGASNKLIAEKLNLSEGSVKVYTSRIYGKLGVSSRTQAIAAAQRLQLFQAE